MTGILDRAKGMLGMSEHQQLAAITDYLKTGGQNLDPATQAWCAAFVNATLQQSGLPGTNSPAARSFLKYGQSVDTPQPGDLAVFSRGDPNGPLGHVGFFQGYSEDGKSIKVLGGNQDDAVSVKEYPVSRLLGFRRPPLPGETQSAEVPDPQGTAMGGFAGGPSQVAARQPSPGGIMANIQPAKIDGTASFKPTSFQDMMGRQAMEGDPSQRARLLKATGLDPTGNTRLNPRGMDNPGLLALLSGKAGGVAPAKPAGGILDVLKIPGMSPSGSSPLGGLFGGGGLLGKILGSIF